MTTIFYPDRSQFQGQRDVTGEHALCARAGEGDWLTDSAWSHNRDQARKAGIPLLAYWFLEDGSSAKAQAAKAFAVVGKGTPLMLDLEPIAKTAAVTTAAEAADRAGGTGHWCGSAWRDLMAAGTYANFTRHPSEAAPLDLSAAAFISRPTVTLACEFIDAYRELGGTIHVLYFPQWYWGVLGVPPLVPFAMRRMVLASSDYSQPYSDHGPGWAPYGGMTPGLWQYTDHGPGAQDWNAYRAHATSTAGFRDAVAELAQLWATGTTAQHEAWRVWETAGKRSLAQIAEACGMTPHRVLHATARHFDQDDAVTQAYVNGVFEGTVAAAEVIPAGAKLWVLR